MSTAQWAAISAAGGQDEREAVRARLGEIPFSYAENRRVLERAVGLVEGCRSRADERSVLEWWSCSWESSVCATKRASR